MARLFPPLYPALPILLLSGGAPAQAAEFCELEQAGHGNAEYIFNGLHSAGRTAETQ